MKKDYVVPELEVIELEDRDIISISNDFPSSDAALTSSTETTEMYGK